MKSLVFFSAISSALALPPLEEAREILSSAEMNEREALTQEIWKQGKNAIPLLEQLSQEFGVSRERVRQIEVRAFEKVQEAVVAASAMLEERGAAGR